MRLAGLLVSLAMMSLAQGQTAVGYTEDFQAYGTPSNPPGWVDTSVGNPKPAAGGLYKTWSDPLQGNHGPNIVYGTKQSSGKPEGNNPRIGTFSTLTAKTFTAKGHFELRGRLIRTTADARIGLTVLSSYPEQDKYYLLGLWSKPGNASRLTMQLFAFGAGTPAGTLDSDVSLDVNKWYQFSIQLDDANNATRIQARFWLDGTTEPTTFSIDATDSAATRLITGRIGMWAAVRGDAYIDDLNAKSAGDNTAPVITFVDADTQRVLDPLAVALFKTPARIEIRVTDDNPNPTYTAKLDTNTTYVSGTAITADGQHEIKVHAVDATGNAADATLKLLVDQQPPVIALRIDNQPFDAGAVFNKDVTLSAVITDISQVTKLSELDGNVVTLPLLVADEKLHQIKVTATDQVGWESTATSSFIVDKTPPVIEIKANGAVMNGGESFIADPTLSWTATDLTLDQVTATLDGNAFTSGSVVSVDGVHTLVVTAGDRAGHTKTETRSFALDKSAPEVHLLANNAPFVAGTTFNAPVTFTADIHSATPTTKDATIDDQTYTLGTAYGVEGVHSIKLIVTNAAGLPTTVGPFPFTVDLTRPVVTLTESGEPFRDGMKFARDVNPVVTATDNLTANPERTLLVDGNPYPLDTPVSEEQIDHTISASAKDAGGNTATVGPYHFMLDKTKPVVTIGALDPLYNHPVTVKITVVDLTHTTLVATVDGAPLAIGPDGTSAPISGDGLHTVSAIATDEVGNSNDAVTASFTIDTTAPHLTFTSHHDGDVLSTPLVTIAGGSDDALAVSVNDVPAIVDTDAKTFSGATLSLVEGTNTITASGTDKAGNPGSASITLILDTRAPEIAIAQPAADACLDATTLTVSGTATDARIASVTVNDVAATLNASTWSASIPVNEGRQLITVVATDTLGHTTTVTRSVVIDRTAPAIEVRESGAPFTATLINRAVSLVIRANDDDLTVKLDGVAQTLLSVPVSSEGAHVLEISATDCAGHKTDRTLTFTIDLTPPTIRNLNPANAATVGTTPTAINGTTDTDAARVDILGSTRSATPNADGTFTLAGVPFADGVNRFTLQATDKAGNYTTLDYAVTVKTAAPVVTILESGSRLVAGTLFNRSVTPELRSSDATATITATLNSAPFTSGTAVTADGNYTLSATATDALNHSGHADTTFVIDRTPPLVKITSPASGVVSADHVEVRGTAGDSISASVNGIPVTLAADGTFILPSLPLEFGTTPIVATGRDRAGNTGRDQVEVTLADARPGIILTYPPDHSLTNRTTTEVLGRVLSQPADHQVTIGTQSVPVDPSGAFRLSGYALVEGENTITATVKSNSATVHVTGDFTPPALNINESGQPLAEDARFATQAVLTLTASDNSGSVTSELTLDGTKVVTLPVTVTTNGGHSASAIARDAAGNESRVDRTFFIGAATGGGNNAGCALTDFDPADNAVVLSSSSTLVGRSGGALGVKVNGVAASVADGSFRATVELPNEGANAVTIVCTDGSGNPTGTPVTITLNRITGAPSISIDAPAEGFITGSETITVTGSVGPGVTKADVNGATATITGSTFSAANVRLAPGLNVLVAHGKNDAGRMASASRRVFLLKDAPAISISAPIPGISTGSASIAVSGTWTNLDPATIVVTNVTSGVVVPSPGLAASDTAGTFNLAGIALVPGEQTLKVTGRDRIDREAVATVNVKLLAGTPSVAIAQPLDHAYFGPAGGDTFAVSGTFQGAAGSTVDVNGSAATLSGASYNATIPFATGAGGITPVIARVTEPAGASAIASIVVTKLSAAPKVIESFPAPNAVEVDPGALLLVLFSAPMDRASLAGGGFRLEDASGATVSGTLYLDKDVITFAPAALLIRGASYTIRVTVAAKDVAGSALAAEYTAPFTIGTTAPSTAPTLTPVANAFCGQLVTIKGTAPAGARLRLDSGTVSIPGTADAQGNFTISFPLSGQSGYATVRVRVVGSDGSFSPAAELTFRVDCAGPQVLNATYDRGGANRIAIVFSEAIDPATVDGAISLTLSDGRVVNATSSVNGSNVTVTPAEDLSAKSFTLNVTTAIKDVIGNKLVTPFTQSFNVGGEQPPAGDGTGFITGEIYDATTGRPLAGAAITIEVPATAFAKGARASSPQSLAVPAGDPGRRAGRSATADGTSALQVTTTSDARGRYLVRLPEGAHTIKATMTGYTTVWRQIIVTAGAGVIPIDIRLTRIGAAGGETSITRKVTLTGGGSATLTAVGGQALTGLLPLGWSPLASAVVGADAPLTGATLKFTVPAADIAAATQNLSAVRYDELRDTWQVLVPVVNILTDGTVSIPIDGAGSYALVYPDKAPGLAQPALATAGAPLQGVAAPVTEPALITRGPLHLDPPVVLPNGRTAATLNIEGLGNATFPSGTAVQAYIDEELKLADGSSLLDPPFATDLLLYRALNGETGVSDFHLAPSPRAAQVILEIGFDHIRVVPYPGRLDRGTLVGAEGGRVPADDKVAIELPTGATPEPLRATAASLAQSDLDAVGTIPGFRILGGFNISLQRATEPAPQDLDGDGKPDAVAPVELFKTARATFTIDPTKLPTPASQLILAELLADTPYGKMVRLAAQMTSIDATRYTTRAIDRGVLPLDGIIREGRYLLLAAEVPLAYATGSVHLGIGGSLLANARVTANALGVADLTRVDGIYNIPVAAVPAGPFTLTPRHTATGDGAVYTHASGAAAESINHVDLNLVPQPPALTAVTVIAFDASQHALSESATTPNIALNTNVRASFSPAIDPASITDNAIIVIDAQTGETVSGKATGDSTGITWTLTAGGRLKNDHRYSVTIASTIRGTNGSSLGRTVTYSFTTVAALTSTEVHAERIGITIPDANGFSRVFGLAGALPTGWQAVVVRRTIDFITRYQATAAADGSFTFVAGNGPDVIDRIKLSDSIDLYAVNNAGALAAIIPLTPFVTEDHRGFVAPATSDVRFTSADGIVVAVSAGTFDQPTIINVVPTTHAAVADVPHLDEEVEYATSVRLEFDGVAHKPMELELPVPAGFNTSGKNFILGYRGDSVRGPRIMAVDTLRIVDGKFSTTEDVAQTLLSVSNGQTRVSVPQTVLTGKDIKKFLMRVQRSGVYLALDIRVPVGSGVGWAVMDGFQRGYDLFWDTLASFYAADFYLFERQGRVVIPVITNKPFTVVGVDATTGLKAFSRVYDPIPIGDPNVAVTIPSPEDNANGPYPIFGIPFRTELADINAEEVDIEEIRNFTIRLENERITVKPGDDPLPAETKVQIVDITNGKFISGSAAQSLTLEGKAGDRLVLLIEQKDIDPSSALSVTFNEPIYVDGKDDDAIDAFLQTQLKLELADEPVANAAPAFTDITKQGRYTLDSGGRRLAIELPSSLQREAIYRLTLKKDIADRSGPDGMAGLKLGQGSTRNAENVVTPAGGGNDLQLVFHTRKPGGKLASFDIASGLVRDLAINGNVLLVTTTSIADGSGAALLAYDIADPASLNTANGGTAPKPLAKVQSSFNTSLWAVASDPHGRIYITEQGPILGSLHSYRLDDLLKSTDSTPVKQKSGAVTNWTLGYSSSLPLGTTLLSDRPESIPRKLQILLQDDETTYDSRDEFKTRAGATETGSYANGVKKYSLSVPFETDHDKNPYLTQRVTVENVSLDMRWSVDVTQASPATITNIIAAANDRIKVTKNLRTYGVISHMGYGIGVYDLNAIESNDVPNPPAAYKTLAEQIVLTPGANDPACFQPNTSTAKPPDYAIPDLTLSPEAAIRPGVLKTSELRVFAPDPLRGLLDLRIGLDKASDNPDPLVRPEICDQRAPVGLILRSNNPDEASPRLAALATAFQSAAGREPFSHFISISPYSWRREAQDNAAGVRGSNKNAAVTRDYLLLAGGDLGVIVIEVGGSPRPNIPSYPSYWPLQHEHVVDVIWVPGGAVAVRTIPRTNMAVIVDRTGRVLIADLSRLDERFDQQGKLIPGTPLFATVAHCLSEPAAGNEGVGAYDPRIIWKSEKGIVTGTLPPVVDGDTGMVYAGELMKKALKVVAALDPRIEMKVDIGEETGLSEVGGVVPLGIAPPANVAAKINDLDPCGGETARCRENASLGTFRLELTLPGAIVDSLTKSNKQLQLAVESERVFNAPTDQTPAGFPRSHLRRFRRDGKAEDPARAATNFKMQRVVPDDPALEKELRHQRGFNKFVSPWIVALADPRASARYQWGNATADQKKDAGCEFCARPKYLEGKSEDDGVYEMWTNGRIIAVRPEWVASNGSSTDPSSIFANTPYEYLGEDDRLVTRFATIMADTVRPTDVRIAAQNPPVAEGAFQETTMLHSGELITRAVDLVPGGRASSGVVLNRSYHSRTIGGAFIGQGWESSAFQRLRALPNGDVELRDASGEIWLFKQKTQNDNAGRYESPKGFFAKLTRADTGWRLLDQKWRVTSFDELGRITSETDEFYKLDTESAMKAGIDNGNIIRYLYDESGRLARIVDPVKRATTFEYWKDSESQEPGAYPGLLKEIKDWRERTVEYLYDSKGQLETVKMPEVKAGEGVPQTYEFTDAKRPRSKYTYKTFVAPSAGATPDQGFNDFLELQNLATITDPAEAVSGGDIRVTFSYDESAEPLRHDRQKRQIWAGGEFATFTYNGLTSVESIDAFGQKRTYTLTEKDTHDKRIHVEKKTLEAVPVVEFPGGLPPKADLNLSAGGKNLETSYEFNDEGLYEVEHYPNGLKVTNTWGQITNSGPGKVLLGALYTGAHMPDERSAFGYDKDTAAGNLLTVTKSNANGSTQRDQQMPSRERLTVESNDEGAGRKQEYDTNGLLKSNSTTTGSGGTVTLEHSLTYYSADATLLIARGRVFSESKGNDTLRQNYVYSNGTLGGYHLRTSDVIRGTTTDTDYDAYDRVVHVVMRDGTAGTVLADEATGYDASGRIAYFSRKQKDAGNVVTTITYDEIGRETKRTLTGAAVNGSPSTLTTTARYDLPGLTITRTDPAVGTEGGTEITTLDHLGRPVKSTHIAGTSLTEFYGYDSASMPTYVSDGTRIAILRQRDELHREIASVGSDGLSSKKSYDEWGRLIDRSGSDTGGNIITHSAQRYSKNGRLRLVNEQVDESGRTRSTRFGWDDGDLTLTTRVGESASLLAAAFPSGKVRAEQTTRDAAGRVKETLIGEATGAEGAVDASSAFSRTTFGYQGFAPNVITQYEPLAAGASSLTITMFDGLGRPLELAQSGGSSSSKNQFDEASNVVSHTSPGMKEEKATYDSRGLVTTRTLTDGRTQEFQYDETGALTSRRDESGETTTYTNDDLGRVTKIQYADGTTEEKQYEFGSGFLTATKDRAGQWISREYDDNGRLIALHDGQAVGGPPLMTYEYDAGGRMTAVRNADGAIEFAEFDLLGRPKITRSIRYASHSGLSARTIADVHSQRHSWSIFDGERSAYRMPDAGATPQGFDSLSSPWMQTIAEERDAGSNVVRQTENSDPIAEAVGRGIGRIQLRRQFVGSKSLDTSYGFADGGTIASGVQLPAGTTANLQSFLLRWTQSKIGNTVVGGSANNRDSADRVSQTRDQGLGGRVSEFRYDDLGRLNTSWLNVPGPAAATIAQSDSFVDADFRSARLEPPQLSIADRQKLGTAAAEIEPPSWTATHAATAQIGSRTILLGDASSVTRNYAFTGGRRTNDGKWTSSFDAFGHLTSISSTDAGRRVDYLWDPAGRLIGRTAFRLDGTSSWVPEDRGEAIAHDGIPADTTFVWDPVSDRLLAIYEAGKSVSGTGGTTAGLVRQYLHGDQGFDDPVRVVMPGANGNVTYLPIVDQAGGGSLQAVVDNNGTMVERVLYADSYGDAPRYLQGPIVDRISFAAKKDGSGELQSVDVKVHFTEAIDSSTVAGGVRLAAIDAAKTVVYQTGVVAATDDANSVHWSLTKTDWDHFRTAVNGASLEIAIGNTLRASAWGDATVTAAPHWTRTIYGTDSTSQFPVITRQSLASVAAFISGVPANGEESTDFYSIPSLYLAGSEESKAKLLFDFHALPFHDPATHLVYARARWYDPATGTFLTPDRLGFVDSSNLYAFGAGDPVNHRDPSGDCAGVDSVKCGDYAREVNDEFNNPMNWVGNTMRSGRFAAFEVKGYVMAAPRAAKGLWDILKDPVGARMKAADAIVNFAVAATMDPGEVASDMINGAINANPDDVAEMVGDALFWATVERLPKVQGIGLSEDTLRFLKKADDVDAAAALRKPRPNIVYRAINLKDAERLRDGLGLEAKNPAGKWTLGDHIRKGSFKSSWANDPWISTSSDIEIAKAFDSGYGIVEIDLNKVTSSVMKGWEHYPRVNGVDGLPYHFSVWQQEHSIFQYVPREAIVKWVR